MIMKLVIWTATYNRITLLQSMVNLNFVRICSSTEVSNILQRLLHASNIRDDHLYGRLKISKRFLINVRGSEA
jgi:hypothetical protein